MTAFQSSEGLFSGMNVTPAPRKALGDSVFDSLRLLLENNQIAAGTPLNIDEIAREFGVSQTPVREALVRLEAVYLVERVASRGYRVSKQLSGEELHEYLKVREAIESQAARWAYENDSVAVATMLLLNVQEQRDALARRDIEHHREFDRADREFHRIIYTNCGNDFLERIADDHAAQLRRIRRLSDLLETDGICALQEHREIAEAFVSGDADFVERTMRSHLENVSARAIHNDSAPKSAG